MDLVSLLILAQLLFDTLLLVLIFFLYRRLGRLEKSDLQKTIVALKEIERLTKNIEENLEEKRRLIERLEDLLSKHRPGASFLKTKVKELLEAGLPPEEIARRLNTPQGEIEIIISLLDQEKSSSSI
ncbi:hypothetical protein [Thermosulfuriphilus sp.]